MLPEKVVVVSPTRTTAPLALVLLLPMIPCEPLRLPMTSPTRPEVLPT